MHFNTRLQMLAQMTSSREAEAMRRLIPKNGWLLDSLLALDGDEALTDDEVRRVKALLQNSDQS